MGRRTRGNVYRVILLSMVFLLAFSLIFPAQAATEYKTDLGTFYYSLPYGVGRGGATYKDGLMYDNRDPRYGYNVMIKFDIAEDAKIYKIIFYGDAQGVSEINIVKPNTNKKITGTVYYKLSGGYTGSKQFEGSRTTASEVKAALPTTMVSEFKHNDNDTYAKVEISLGNSTINGTVEFTFNVYTGPLPEGYKEVDVTFYTYVIVYYYDPVVDQVVSKAYELKKVVTVSKPPMLRFILAASIAIVSMGIVYALSVLGFFESFTTVDLVTIAVLAAFQAVRVQIIGRQLVFPLLDRVPGAYNFAVADFPFIMLLIIAAYIVKKPGSVTLTLFLYNIISEIGRYGINPLRRAYPFAQGVVPDLYLLLRYKLTSVELFADKPLIKGITVGHVDGFFVGFFRGLFMQLSLYLVFYPVLFRLQYDLGYVLIRITIPRAIGNGIEGAISVPIAKKVEEAIQYRDFKPFVFIIFASRVSNTPFVIKGVTRKLPVIL